MAILWRQPAEDNSPKERRTFDIVVCAKQVLDTRLPLFIDRDGVVRQQQDQQVYIVNPVDRSALEAAKGLKKQTGAQITILTVGPERAQDAIYYCLAQGADQGIYLKHDGSDPLDSNSIALILSKALANIKYDLILCGNTSLDNDDSETGIFLAEMLGLPHVMDVIQFEILPDLKRMAVQRRLEKGRRESLECPLPAVLVVDKLIQEPGYVSVHSYLMAKKRALVKHEVGTLWPDSSTYRCLMKTSSVSLPRPRPKRNQAINANVSVEERLNQLMGGGATKTKRAETLTGAPDQIAVRVIQYLKSEGVISS